jgi:hypothetical protein
MVVAAGMLGFGSTALTFLALDNAVKCRRSPLDHGTTDARLSVAFDA